MPGRALKDRRQEIKERQLTGEELKKAIVAEIDPLEVDENRRRREWRVALRKAVPSPELAIGKRIDCTVDEYRKNVVEFRDSVAKSGREPLDFLAAFASDACLREKSKNILDPTPFCFISGSGHQ